MKLKATFSLILLSFLVFGLKTKAGSDKIQEPLQSKEFSIKGFHIDLRIQVMTLEALKDFADELAGFEINTIIMEYEASYPYEKHATISNDLAYTREEIKAFISHCQKIGIDVIPLQQCFGHVEYILRNDRYRHLKEDRQNISQVCPLKVQGDSILFADLFTDMASLHPSEYIHIGGDETRLLGHCNECSKKAAEEGKSKLFVDYMKMMCNIVIGLGKKPVMWADIVLRHPEAATELPEETVFIDWNYGWKTNYFGNISGLQQKGLTFWGAPALRCHPDNWYVTDWEKHLNNLHDFIPYARRAGYEGIIMTSWSTTGLYGYTWDVGYEVVDMVQVRNTYPLSGFRILVAAYAQSLKQTEPLDQKKFVLNYAKERFGLDGKNCEEFWQALTIPAELIIEGKPVTSSSIDNMRLTVDTARRIMNELKPLRNKKEIEHFRLMLDLRAHYLAFKEIEAAYNSKHFSRNKIHQLIPRLEELFVQSEKLDKRFTELNKGFISDAELEEQNMLRNQKLHVLYNRLKGNQDTRTTNFPQKEETLEFMPPKKKFWIFIMAGQSNMAGRGFVEPQDTIPNQRVLTINSQNEWILAKEPLHFYQPLLTGLDCGLVFGKTLAANLDESVYIGIIPTAVGGSSVKQWLNDSLFNDVWLYSNFKNKVALAKQYGSIKGILWHQGETDAITGQTASYKEELMHLFDNFRKETGNRSLPVFMGELGLFARDEVEKANWDAINTIIHDIAAEDRFSYVVQSSDLKSSKDDPFHFNSKSQRILGKRYAEKYLKELKPLSPGK